MNRSGYSDATEAEARAWNKHVLGSMRACDGEKFLKDLRDALDALPEKILIAESLVAINGARCALGCAIAARGIDAGIIQTDIQSVAWVLNIGIPLAREIVYRNDEHLRDNPSPEARWAYMREWVEQQLVAEH